MKSIRLLINPMRTAKQGVQVNVGKFGDDYQSLVTALSMHEEDMRELGVEGGQQVLVRTDHGEAEFVCDKSKVPQGMAFVPYGPPTCQLMGGDTGGTGMPTSKGWEADVIALPAESSETK
ncbi:MAG: molybdopterin dinucleotide binding domain-containing protein [Planctomycetota bacterium]|nr:molybdopterin dinucleotide binding domain-containing protein [Planctomycetota bacterium]